MGSDTVGAKQCVCYNIQSAGLSALEGLECIEVYEDTIWTFTIIS